MRNLFHSWGTMAQTIHTSRPSTSAIPASASAPPGATSPTTDGALAQAKVYFSVKLVQVNKENNPSQLARGKYLGWEVFWAPCASTTVAAEADRDPPNSGSQQHASHPITPHHYCSSEWFQMPATRGSQTESTGPASPHQCSSELL